MSEPTYADYERYWAGTHKPWAITGAVTAAPVGKPRTFTLAEFREFGRAIWAQLDREKREKLLDAQGDLGDMLREEAWGRKMKTVSFAIQLHAAGDLKKADVEALCVRPVEDFL